MGVTNYITITTHEYALLARLEGQARALLATKIAQSYEVDRTGPARAVIRETLDALDKRRNGHAR